MNSELSDNFKTLAAFPGLGNINSKIWFVGIEEGGEAINRANLDEQLRRCREGEYYFENPGFATPVWNYIARLTWEKFYDSHKLNAEEYRMKMFLPDFSYFFLTELFPLSRPNTQTWPEHYLELFGYSGKEFHKYISDVRCYRYPIIYKLWEQVKPNITICFGAQYWNEFINLFQLGHGAYESYEDLRIQYFPDKRILLTPFFSNRSINMKEVGFVKDTISKLPLV